MGIAVVAAFAISSTPTLAGRQVDSIPVAFSPLAIDTAAYSRPVEVSLLSGVDAIAWDMENITSAAAGVPVADASDPGSALGFIGTPGQLAGHLVGQNVGALGVLPGGIQLIHPVSSRHITSPYGWRNNPTGPGTQIHIGQDYAIPCGSPVYATAAGLVVQSAWAGHSGMRVTIDHGSSVRTGYSHNSRLIAKVGDRVSQGQLIALSGTTGNSTGCHVHFEVIINGRWNDPRNFLPIIPGQPNPKIDSRRTTIAAEPIRNSGEPRNESKNGHDIEVELPEPTKAPPSQTARASETPTAKPSEGATPDKEPTPTPKPSQTPPPTPKPSAKPSPTSPSPTSPSPAGSPTPETSPTPEPSEESTPPIGSSPTTTAPTVAPSSEPSESPTSALTQSPTASLTESAESESVTPATEPSDSPTSTLTELPTTRLAESLESGSVTPATESPSGTPTKDDRTAPRSSSVTAAKSS
ncbi:peptidoglycan DD-metalloendopeptidase family protein [Paeniglutamicibacter sp.]|uniref:M23 family metallopeptidase n=1 Tax=Paeniglutamicibacter sp. TaxID=1934391 RepID=UPI003988D11E